MTIFKWLEDGIHKVIPRIEVSDFTETKFDTAGFDSLISKISHEPDFTLKTRKEREFVLTVNGRVIGDLKQCGVLFGKTPTPQMYKNMGSKIKVTHQNDGRLKIESFDHFIALKREREAVKGMLQIKLDAFKNKIDTDSAQYQ